MPLCARDGFGGVVAIFYRGAGVDTYWFENDARLMGFVPRFPGMQGSPDRICQHIARSTTSSPYVSLTRSYAVARDYAIFCGYDYPSAVRPAYVYEIEVDSPVPSGVHLIDPVKELGLHLNDPVARNTYQHDGHQDFIMGVVDQCFMAHSLTRICAQPPGSGGTPRSGLHPSPPGHRCANGRHGRIPRSGLLLK